MLGRPKQFVQTLPSSCLAALVRVVRTATVEHVDSIEAVVEQDLVGKLVKMFDTYNEDEELRIEVAWVLTNVAAHRSEYCELLVAVGAQKRMVKGAESKNRRLRDQV